METMEGWSWNGMEITDRCALARDYTLRMAERKTRRMKWWLQHQKPKKQETSGDTPKGQKKHSDVKGSIISKQGFTKKASKSGDQNPKSHRTMQRGFRTARTGAAMESDGTSDTEEPSNSDSRQPESQVERPSLESASDSESTSEDEAKHDAAWSKTIGTKKEPRQTKRKRYILFAGNLPFTATPEDISGHFQKRGVPVKEVRMLTKKDSGESRGCCFLEFDSSKRLQNALKLHHTAMEGRRINVEVTCGGGGRGEGRQKKIEEKKMKLVKSKRAEKKNKVDS